MIRGARHTLGVLRDLPAAASWNMAVDAALLELADRPVLRLYGWEPHAVSLGWFQRIADFADVPAETPIVRRLTGGGAIWHGDELTFALVLPAARLPRDPFAGYALVHGAVARALAEIGVIARLCEHGPAPSGRPHERWCFASPSRGDLVTDRGKLLGSAQRRIGQSAPRVLHHGSLVVRRPAATPFVAAIEDQVQVTTELRDRLADALVVAVADVLESEHVPQQLTAAQTALSRRLCADVFGAPEHTMRR